MNLLPHQIKIRALHDDVIITEMNFDEIKTTSGIILRSDNGKSHGVRPRWGKVYAIGPEQKDVNVGQWILVEHGRWTRGIKIDDGAGEKVIQKVDVNCIMAVSDQEPSFADDYIPDSV
jgi:co-chaperonin GroES (HSP10)